MNASDAAMLLALCAAFDQRTVGESDAYAWAEVLGDIDPTDAKQSITDHYRRTRDRIMPADVLDGVKRLRRARLEAAFDAAPDADPDDVQAYIAALRAGRTRAADAAALSQRPVAALTIGKPVPADAEVRGELRRRLQAVAYEKQARVEQESTQAQAHREAMAQANAELEPLRAALAEPKEGTA